MPTLAFVSQLVTLEGGTDAKVPDLYHENVAKHVRLVPGQWRESILKGEILIFGRCP